MTAAPLFSFRAARIQSPNGDALSPGLTFETDAARVVLVGPWEPLVSLLTGRAAVTSGSAAVLGRPPERAAFENRLSLALSDPPFPEKPTPLEHLTQSARLLGLGRREAGREAERALESFGLGHVRKRKLKTLGELERRTLSLAHATLGSPEALLADDPLEGLDDASAEHLAASVERAAEGRRLVVILRAPGHGGPEHRFVERAGYAAVAVGGAVVAEGAPADVLGPSRGYVLSVLRGAEALAAALKSRGIEVRQSSEGASGDAGGRLLVELPDGGDTAAVLAAALEAGVPLVELAAVGLSARRTAVSRRGP